MSLDVIKWIKGWRLDKAFHSFKEHADKIAISITEAVKTVLDGKVVSAIAEVIDHALGAHVAEDVLKVLNSATLKALAVELAIQGLPDNPNEEEGKIFEDTVVKAITGLDPKGRSKFLTTFAAQVYGLIKDAVDSGETLTFAAIVGIIENAYQLYLTDLKDSE